MGATALGEDPLSSLSSSELLRIATSGSVDDGKSTLIGRLLHDSEAILEDQLEHVISTSARRGDGYVNLALLTDGLRAEREQGITIDVAYRYFATPQRRFIIADTPGHEQYTRNMVTGASTADLSMILIDARNGIGEQTRRHAYIASLLGIPHLVVCVNKMDLVGYRRDVFEELRAQMAEFLSGLPIADVTFIPISALRGDNVVEPSERMDWYRGEPLLRHLEHVVITADRNLEDVRLPVQWVIRPMSEEHHDYRGYAGQVAGGVLATGDEVLVLPGGHRSRIAAVETYDGELEAAFPTMSVTVRLADDVDVSRGDMIVGIERAPEPARELEAMLCWFSPAPLTPRSRYAIKHTTRSSRVLVEAIDARIDVNTLAEQPAQELVLNDIARVRLRCGVPLVLDPYTRNRTTGSFILIDESSGDTVAAGMVLSSR